MCVRRTRESGESIGRKLVAQGMQMLHARRRMKACGQTKTLDQLALAARLEVAALFVTRGAARAELVCYFDAFGTKLVCYFDTCDTYFWQCL